MPTLSLGSCLPVSVSHSSCSVQLGKERADPQEVAGALQDLGLRFGGTDVRIQSMMAFGMFDSRMSHKCACTPGLLGLPNSTVCGAECGHKALAHPATACSAQDSIQALAGCGAREEGQWECMYCLGDAGVAPQAAVHAGWTPSAQTAPSRRWRSSTSRQTPSSCCVWCSCCAALRAACRCLPYCHVRSRAVVPTCLILHLAARRTPTAGVAHAQIAPIWHSCSKAPGREAVQGLIELQIGHALTEAEATAVCTAGGGLQHRRAVGAVRQAGLAGGQE